MEDIKINHESVNIKVQYTKWKFYQMGLKAAIEKGKINELEDIQREIIKNEAQRK